MLSKLPSVAFMCHTPAVLTITGGLDQDGAPEIIAVHNIKVMSSIKRGEVLSGERLTRKEMSQFAFEGSLPPFASGTIAVNGELWHIKAVDEVKNPDGSTHHTTLYCTA